MAKTISPYDALLHLVEIAGSQAELGRRLGLSNVAIWKWVNKSKRVTAEYVLSAEREFGVSRHDLRPDLYPREATNAPARGHQLSQQAA